MAWWIWLLISLFSFLFEILTPGVLVSIWFALAALIVAPVSLLSGSFIVQIFIFALLSILLIAYLRPVLVKIFTPEHHKTNADQSIGQIATVTKTIESGKAGRVELAGMDWMAIGEGRAVFMEGEKVRVKEISGAKLVVGKEKY